MTEFDDQLKQALRRREPPAGLEHRILRRAGAGRPSPGYGRWWQAAAAVALLAAGGWYGVEWRRAAVREQRAEAVRQQVAEAVEIAYRQIARANERAKGIGVERIEYRETER